MIKMRPPVLSTLWIVVTSMSCAFASEAVEVVDRSHAIVKSEKPAAKSNGLAHRRTAGRRKRVHGASPQAKTKVESLVVTGRGKTFSGGALGNRRLIDTPFSIRVVTAAQLQERQVKSLGRVFSEDAAVVTNGDTYSFNAYSLTVRGVPLDDYNGYKINGTPFFMTTVELPLETFQSVQLLKGASGFLYGFNAPGGVVNFETKKPTENQTLSFDAGYSSATVATQHLDAGGRVLKNKALGYRVNLTHEDGTTYNGSHVTRYSGSLSLDARLAENLTWTADGVYQDRKILHGVQDFYILDPSTYSAGVIPTAINGHKNLTVDPNTHFNSQVYWLTTGLQWRVAPHWNFRVDYSHSRDYRSYLGEWMGLQDASGNYTTYMNTNPGSWATYNQVQGVLQGRFHTGFIRHDLTAGATWQGLTKFLPYDTQYDALGGENLYQAIITRRWSGTLNKAVYKNFTSTQTGLFFSDTLTFSPQWSLLAGVRYTDYQQQSVTSAGLISQSTVHPVTPTAALIYHPWRHTTLYATYVQALESGTTVGATYKNAYQTLAPIRSDQVEVGAKVERRAWDLTGALYQITRDAQYANTANVYVSNGSMTYRGAEVSGRVRLPHGIELFDSLGVEHGRYTRTEADISGNAVEGIPLFQNMFQLTGKIPHIEGLTATAEVHYTADMWGNSRNNYLIPSYTLLNLRASYHTWIDHHRLTLRAELDNVQNLHYWGFLQSDYFYVGIPRALYFNAKISL